MAHPGCDRESFETHLVWILNAIYAVTRRGFPKSAYLLPANYMAEGENSGEDGILFISDDDEDSVVKGIGFDNSPGLVGRVRIPDGGRLEMRGVGKGAIDGERYIVTVGSKSGVVSRGKDRKVTGGHHTSRPAKPCDEGLST